MHQEEDDDNTVYATLLDADMNTISTNNNTNFKITGKVLEAGAKVSGYPAMPVSDFLKQTALLRRMLKKKRQD